MPADPRPIAGGARGRPPPCDRAPATRRPHAVLGGRRGGPSAAGDAYRVVELEEARDDFARTHARSLERLGELAHLTKVGPRLLGEAAAINPSPGLIDLLGPPPGFANERPRWIAAAGAVEAYRQRTGLRTRGRRARVSPVRRPPRSAYDAVLAIVVSYDHRRGREIDELRREPGRGRVR